MIENVQLHGPMHMQMADFVVILSNSICLSVMKIDTT